MTAARDLDENAASDTSLQQSWQQLPPRLIADALFRLMFVFVAMICWLQQPDTLPSAIPVQRQPQLSTAHEHAASARDDCRYVALVHRAMTRCQHWQPQ